MPDLIAAGVAFYAPFCAFSGVGPRLIAVLGLLADPRGGREPAAPCRRDVFPDEGLWPLFATQIGTALVTSPDALTLTTLLSLGVALWSARWGVAALIRGLNAILRRPRPQRVAPPGCGAAADAWPGRDGHRRDAGGGGGAVVIALLPAGSDRGHGR